MAGAAWLRALCRPGKTVDHGRVSCFHGPGAAGQRNRTRQQMLRQNHWRVMTAAAAITALGAIEPAAAQDWPSRAISMVVPFSAGSASDTAGRIVAVRMSEILGQQVIVENT